MNHNRGKSTLINMILLLLIAYGGFALVKHLGANLSSKQIASKVKDRLSLERGGDFTVERGEEVIREILKQEGVIFNEGNGDDDDYVEVNLNNERQMIEYSFRYEVDVDFLFFKQRRVFEVEDEIQSYS